MYFIINFILSVVLLPLFIAEDSFMNRVRFIIVCILFTPLVGIPVYIFIRDK